MKYLSTAEAAAKWNLSQRRVAVLCEQQRVTDAQKAESTWIIPEDAEKPVDARVKSGRHRKKVSADALNPKA